MDASSQDQRPLGRQSQDVDLGTVLYKIGKALDKAARLVADFFMALFKLSVLSLIYLRKNIWWLVAGCIAGLGYGVYYKYNSGIRYQSAATVKMNFESSRYLYTSIDYLNSARGSGDLTALAKIFQVSPKEASSIMGFEANPVEDEVAALNMYREKVVRYHRNETLELDSFWVNKFEFDDYKKQLTKYDYPVHQVTVTCTDASIFPKLQDGFIRLISQQEVLKRNQSIYLQVARMEDSVLETSLRQLDTLSSAFSKRIGEGGDAYHAGNTVTVQEKPNVKSTTIIKSPALELFNTKVSMKNQLAELRIKSVSEQDIVQFYAPFNPIGGRAAPIYSPSYLKSALYGLLIASVLVLGFGLFRYLGTLDPQAFRITKH